MKYNSTVDKSVKVTAAEAIAHGIAKDGGLFVPVELPKYSECDFEALRATDYCGRAKKIFADFLDDFTAEEIDECVTKAYTAEKFGSSSVPAPISNVKYGNAEMNILELWHGPTSAFKDMALQILPHLLTKSVKKTQDGKQAVILVATSGDTGKAALEGFKDVDGTKIVVFYPQNGVSPMQKHQMNTQEGNNVNVCAIKGNFDDAQTGVKAIFTNEEIISALEKNNMSFSSANSINWGRLLPQIVYYISAYCDLVNDGKINSGDKVNIVVPTGNFGNILAAYYAGIMGLPINKFICASNSNNVLTEFIKTGVYDRNRHFYTTISPSMDILVSSNLERLLYHACGEDDKKVKEWMSQLKTTGKYKVDDDVFSLISERFFAGCCDDENTKKTIGEVYAESNYLCDTHTAVAVNVYKQYVDETGDSQTPCILASTASPYKFSKSVLEAIDPSGIIPKSEFAIVERLNRITGVAIPAPLAQLENKTVRFNNVTEADKMPEYVLSALGI